MACPTPGRRSTSERSDEADRHRRLRRRRAQGPCGVHPATTDPTKPDTDGDGLNDLVETATGKYVSTTDTGSNPKKADSDNDGLTDAQEVNRVHHGPNKPDTDGDGFSDAAEIADGSNPLDPTTTS